MELSTPDILHSCLDDNPQDWIARLALADWCEQEQRDEEARYWRWTVSNGFAPRYFATFGWIIFGTQTFEDPEDLPVEIAVDLTGEDFTKGSCLRGHSYKTRQDAERDVHRVLQTLGYPTIRQPQEIAPCTPTH